MLNRLETARNLLDPRDQGHLLQGFDSLDPHAAEQLLDQVESLHWDVIDQARDVISGTGEAPVDPDQLAPVESHVPDADSAETLRSAGEERIAAGQIAALTVAGGQGTRLGWNGPKGTYPATPVSGKPLFACFAEQLRAVRLRYGADVPWYIITSPTNDSSTRNFLLDNKCFGLDRDSIMLVQQGTMPSFDAETGRILLSGPGRIATSPDGHGGSLDALHRSGALSDMESRGTTIISYSQVDNPLAKIVDPVFIGLHVDEACSSAEASSKMVLKTDPTERVGVFGLLEGRTCVIEYSDLPGPLASAVDADGRLRFHAANIAMHLFSLSFIQSIVGEGGAGLPWHRALKDVPSWDPETRELQKPSGPNAVKLERFIFDVLGRAGRSAILATDRAEEFAPIKNSQGPDSPLTSRQLQSDLFARWLEERGVAIPWTSEGHVDAAIEIAPGTAQSSSEIPSELLPGSIEPGSSILL